ncbi:MAG: hypothetical protein WBE58_23000 [Verrucomicrobiales bacterium]|nr:hypothetical protein [Verrucomicrobiales bacterium]
MKNTTTQSIRAILFAGMLLTTSHTFAQAGGVTTKTYTTSEGIVSKFGHQEFLITREGEELPVRYTYGEETSYIDEDGHPIAVTTVKSGLPVTVYYTKVGDTLVASKVMVRRESAPAGAPLSAVVVQGTIGEFGSNRIILNPVGSTESVHYAYGETTTYVDEDGHPIAVTTVKSGLPVTIYYTRSGDTLVATKVIVRKELIAPNSVIERKTTTTTTTKEN